MFPPLISRNLVSIGTFPTLGILKDFGIQLLFSCTILGEMHGFLCLRNKVKWKLLLTNSA